MMIRASVLAICRSQPELNKNDYYTSTFSMDAYDPYDPKPEKSFHTNPDHLSKKMKGT
ncbi:MAG: hypothetical protein WBZ36_06750 [Candidatus Nitrosopolaris sp.]